MGVVPVSADFYTCLLPVVITDTTKEMGHRDREHALEAWAIRPHARSQNNNDVAAHPQIRDGISQPPPLHQRTVSPLGVSLHRFIVALCPLEDVSDDTGATGERGMDTRGNYETLRPGCVASHGSTVSSPPSTNTTGRYLRVRAVEVTTVIVRRNFGFRGFETTITLCSSYLSQSLKTSNN